MPKAKSPDDIVTIVRDDGKKFNIKRSLVAEHINRGNFKVADKADEPTLDERKNAVGFSLKKAATAPGEKADGTTATQLNTGNGSNDGKKPIEEWTVAELKDEAKRIGVEVPNKAKRDEIIALVTAKLKDIVDTEMVDHVVTEEDLKANAQLVAAGVQVGDTIKVPKE